MARVVADARVEDIVQCVLPEEHVADDAHAPSDLWVRPQSAQVSDRVDDLLLHLHLRQEVVVVDSVFCQQGFHLLVVPLDETDDALAEVLGDVLRLVLEPSLHPLA